MDNSNEKTKIDSKLQISSQSQDNSGESEPDTMEDNFFEANTGNYNLSQTFKRKKDRKLSFKTKNPLKVTQKSTKFESILESTNSMSETELLLKGLRENHLSVSQIEVGEARQKLIDVAQTAINEKKIVQK